MGRAKSKSRVVVKVSPRKALAKVRKPVPRPTRVAESDRAYHRAAAKRGTREIIVTEQEGC